MAFGYSWNIEQEKVIFTFQGISDITTDAFLLEISLENILIFSKGESIFIDFFTEKQRKITSYALAKKSKGYLPIFIQKFLRCFSKTMKVRKATD